MSNWVRLWEDMPTDPKWRVVARRSGQPVPAVIAVFTILMVEGGKAGRSGDISGARVEDIAAALDMDDAAVEAILEAMQGRVIDGGVLSGWDKRQPKREDSSTQRVREHRERSKSVSKRDETQCNAPDTEADTDTDLSNADALEVTPTAPAEPDDVAEAVEAFNATADLVGWPKAQKITAHRRAALKARLRDCGGLDGWRSAMARARASPFLTGDNDRGWRADFDFFMQAKSFTKLMEGGYDRRDGSQRNAFSGTKRRPSGTDQAISALADAVARRTVGGLSPDDPGGFRFDRGPEDDGGRAGGAPVSAPRLVFGG